jgi:hypothetical protein
VVVAEHDPRLDVPVAGVLGVELNVAVTPADPLAGLGELVDDVGVEQLGEAVPVPPLQPVGEGGHQGLGVGHGLHQSMGPGLPGLRGCRAA